MAVIIHRIVDNKLHSILSYSKDGQGFCENFFFGKCIKVSDLITAM